MEHQPKTFHKDFHFLLDLGRKSHRKSFDSSLLLFPDHIPFLSTSTRAASASSVVLLSQRPPTSRSSSPPIPNSQDIPLLWGQVQSPPLGGSPLQRKCFVPPPLKTRVNAGLSEICLRPIPLSFIPDHQPPRLKYPSFSLSLSSWL